MRNGSRARRVGYFDCPKCQCRTAHPDGCGICGLRSTDADHAKAVANEEEFDRRMRSLPLPDSDKTTVFGDVIVMGPTLLDVLTHNAAMHPTKENIATLTKYERELRALARKRERSNASRAQKSRRAVERVLPNAEYEWATDDRGHEVRRKKP
jgi:hypothetical protein